MHAALENAIHELADVKPFLRSHIACRRKGSCLHRFGGLPRTSEGVNIATRSKRDRGVFHCMCDAGAVAGWLSKFLVPRGPTVYF